MGADAFGIEYLLSPMSPAEFVESYWAKKPLYVPGTPDKFERWFHMDFFRECVAGTSNHVVDDPVFEKQPEHMIATVPFANLRSMNAFSAQFDVLSQLNLNFIIPTDRFVVEYASTLKRELMYPGQIRAQWWSSPVKGGYPIHFDDWGLFVLQVAGTKRWKIQKSPSLVWPLAAAGGLGADGKPEYLGLRSDWERDGAERCTDADMLTWTLRPGDMLYMPAGVFHSTETLDERATALHFNFFPARMSEVFHRFVDDTMTRDVAWRTSPIAYAGSDVRDQANTEQRVRKMLRARVAELRRALDSETVEDDLFRAWQKMVARHEASGPSYIRYRHKRVESIAADDRLRVSPRHPFTSTKIQRPNETVLEIYMEDHEVAFDTPEEIAFGENLLVHHAGFRAGDVVSWKDKAGRALSWDRAREIMQHLVEIDVLERG